MNTNRPDLKLETLVSQTQYDELYDRFVGTMRKYELEPFSTYQKNHPLWPVFDQINSDLETLSHIGNEAYVDRHQVYLSVLQILAAEMESDYQKHIRDRARHMAKVIAT